MYILIFYVPTTHTEEVKEALFKAGGGKIGKYERCSFQSLGEGQFCPKEGSDPYIGSTDVLQRVEEHRVELVVDDPYIGAVVQALIDVHPYEEPAYHVLKNENLVY
ncbi:MAG: NGG1p interacting factor NIF3 [Sphaerochaetaceae bacterium]|jgi:hypothetical protein